MSNPLFRAFTRKSNTDSKSSAPRHTPAPNVPDSPPAATGPVPGGGPAGPVSAQQRAALELAQEFLRGIEHFVLSTPDLDTPGFLDRLRRTAAFLTPRTSVEELELQRQWAADSLCAYGQLQRRYLSEREAELWRLLTLYQDHQKLDLASDRQFVESIQGTHDRMLNAMRLDDLRQVRERLEQEILRAGELIEQKVRTDDERATQLQARVSQLETALNSARHEALRDALTGIYHRGGFSQELESALNSPTSCSLALIDIDNFKNINDTLGHLVGDHVLKIAVQMLNKITRPGEVLGRYGGDEFCILAPSVSPKRLRDRLETLAAGRTLSFQFAERHCSVRLSFSIGITGSKEEDTVAKILQRADAAMYQGKRDGKGRVHVIEE